MNNPVPKPTGKVRITGFHTLAMSFLLALWLVASPAQAQVNDISQVDQRIVEAYGTEYVNRLLEQSPHYLEYLNFYLDNAFYVYHHPAKAGGGLPYVSEVAKNTANIPAAQIQPPNPEDIASFNALLYHFERSRNQRKVYLIDGTEMALIFYSDAELVEMYNASKNQGQ